MRRRLLGIQPIFWLPLTRSEGRSGAPGLPRAGRWAGSRELCGRILVIARHDTGPTRPSELDRLVAFLALMRTVWSIQSRLASERCPPNGNRPGAVDREAVSAEQPARSPRAWQCVLGSDVCPSSPGTLGDRPSSLLGASTRSFSTSSGAGTCRGPGVISRASIVRVRRSLPSELICATGPSITPAMARCQRSSAHLASCAQSLSRATRSPPCRSISPEPADRF